MDTPPPDLERELLAYHEAGHFVGSLARGVVPNRVALGGTDPDDLGSCSGEGLSDAPTLAEVANLVRELYAGHAAVLIRTDRYRDWSRGAAWNDDEKAEYYLALLDGEQGERELREAALELLRGRWAEVEALAHLLLKRTTVDGDEGDLLLCTVRGEEGAAEALASFRALRAARRT